MLGCGESSSRLPVNAGVAHGTAHCLVLAPDGRLSAAGSNAKGQLGFVSSRSIEPVLRQLEKLPSISLATAGNAHSAVLTVTGKVFTFGDNTYGQLGAPEFSYSAIPQAVEIAEPVTSLFSGLAHVLALGASGRVYGWGSNYVMQLGSDKGKLASRPVVLSFDTPVKALSAYGQHSAFLLQDGAIELWGGGGRTRHCCWPGAKKLAFDTAGLIISSDTTQLIHIPISQAVVGQKSSLCKADT